MCNVYIQFGNNTHCLKTKYQILGLEFPPFLVCPLHHEGVEDLGLGEVGEAQPLLQLSLRLAPGPDVRQQQGVVDRAE